MGAAHLVAGSDEPVAVHGLHIQGHVGGTLATVDQYPGTHAMGQGNDLFHRVNAAQGIGNVVNGNQPGLVVD